MLPHEVIRAAALLIRAGSLSQGAHLRDAQGKEMPLLSNTRGKEEIDTSRATITGGAFGYSLYGALATACANNACNPSAIWPIVQAEAARTLEGKLVPGGTNHLHPLMALNELVGFTKEDAIAFLERCALLLEPKKEQA